MPSPAAHSFIGLGIGILRFIPDVSGFKDLFKKIIQYRWELCFCILLANIADIDYIFGIPVGDMNYYHHTVTHTLVWAIVTVTAVWACGWPEFSWRGYLFVFALVVSHLLLDIMTADYSKPYGIMFLWPVSLKYWHSSWQLFPASAKSTFNDLISIHNLQVILAETGVSLIFLIPVLAVRLRKKRKV
jgi:membrane-bound metal-dependent hydrolase YbcI (DUF457 family)